MCAPRLSLARCCTWYKGGRCTGVQALGANLLNLKPCIEVKEGKMQVTKKYCGNLEHVALQMIRDKLGAGEKIDLSKLLIAHYDADAIMDKACRRLPTASRLKRFWSTRRAARFPYTAAPVPSALFIWQSRRTLEHSSGLVGRMLKQQ